MEQKYLSNKKDICPCCNSETLKFYDSDLDDGLVCYHWECSNCKAKGIEYYKLVFTGHCVHNQEIDDLEEVDEYVKCEVDE